jgi:hypothetical protein
MTFQIYIKFLLPLSKKKCHVLSLKRLHCLHSERERVILFNKFRINLPKRLRNTTKEQKTLITITRTAKSSPVLGNGQI